jgi:hypothetical protein
MELLKIIKESEQYADIDMDVTKCIEQYCQENNIPEEIAEKAIELAYRNEAINAGIPISVIEGRTKLTDHFTKEYIDFKTNREELL